MKSRPLGTQAAPACEAGVFTPIRLMTVDCSRASSRRVARTPAVVGRDSCPQRAAGASCERSRIRYGANTEVRQGAVLADAAARRAPASSWSTARRPCMRRWSSSTAPYYFLFKQATWALLGLVLLLVVMRIDYHSYRQPAVIWTLLGVVGARARGRVLFAAAQRRQRWIAARAVSASSRRSSRSSSAIIFTAALLERRMHRINEVALHAAADRRRRRRHRRR